MDEKRESLNIRFLGKDQFFGGGKLVLKFQFQLFLLFQARWFITSELYLLLRPKRSLS